MRLLAPVLVYTADEAWEHAGREGSVHTADFPVADERFAGDEASRVVSKLLEVRALVQTAIEEKIQAKEFKKNNEAAVELMLPAGHPCLELFEDPEFAKEFFIVSEMKVVAGQEERVVSVERTSYPMCPRCRRYEPPVNDEGLCQRCADVLAPA